jgi:hypothetical protein
MRSRDSDQMPAKISIVEATSAGRAEEARGLIFEYLAVTQVENTETGPLSIPQLQVR